MQYGFCLLFLFLFSVFSGGDAEGANEGKMKAGIGAISHLFRYFLQGKGMGFQKKLCHFHALAYDEGFVILPVKAFYQFSGLALAQV